MNVYVFFDAVSKQHAEPVTAPNDDAARRFCVDVLSSVELGDRYIRDTELIRLGSIVSTEGYPRLEPCDPVCVVRGVDDDIQLRRSQLKEKVKEGEFGA